MTEYKDSAVLEAAMAWLEHCREAAEEHFNEGESDTAAKWHDEAERVERAIKRAIDSGARAVDRCGFCGAPVGACGYSPADGTPCSGVDA